MYKIWAVLHKQAKHGSASRSSLQPQQHRSRLWSLLNTEKHATINKCAVITSLNLNVKNAVNCIICCERLLKTPDSSVTN